MPEGGGVQSRSMSTGNRRITHIQITLNKEPLRKLTGARFPDGYVERYLKLFEGDQLSWLIENPETLKTVEAVLGCSAFRPVIPQRPILLDIKRNASPSGGVVIYPTLGEIHVFTTEDDFVIRILYHRFSLGKNDRLMKMGHEYRLANSFYSTGLVRLLDEMLFYKIHKHLPKDITNNLAGKHWFGQQDKTCEELLGRGRKKVSGKAPVKAGKNENRGKSGDTILILGGKSGDTILILED